MTTIRTPAALAETQLGGQALLYKLACDAVQSARQRGLDAPAAIFRQAVAGTPAQAFLLEWASWAYLEMVILPDMRGEAGSRPPGEARGPDAAGGGGGQRRHDAQSARAPADSHSDDAGRTKADTLIDAAGTSDAGEEAMDHEKPRPGLPPAREPSPAERSAARKAAERAAVTIMDTIRVRDGRAIGDVAYGELGRMAASNRREAALFDLIKAHAKPDSEFARVREIVKVVDLQRMIQKSAEIADAQG